MQANTSDDGELEHFPEAGSAFNIGIILVRQTANALAQVLAPEY